MTVHLRGPALHGAGPVDYESTRMATQTLTATTGSDGAFAFATLVPPGPYALTVTLGSQARTVQPTVGVDDTDGFVELSR